jgi:hypothetical protein
MKKIQTILAALLFSLLFHYGYGQIVQAKLEKQDLEKLFKMMSGEFSNASQAKADTDFFHISLRMRPIWKERKGECWLYVEQAMFKMQEKPYRQRIYQVKLEGDSAISSTVYELPKPERFIGAWKDAKKVESLFMDSLISRQGCKIFLHKNKEGNFEGATLGKQCLSSLRGATYATSKVVIDSKKVVSWDQGWDAGDKQIWGAVKGGYIFEKHENW